MKNGKITFVLILSLICLFCIRVEAYNVSSSNNPGVNYSSNSLTNLNGNSTLWPSPYLRTIRIRIFRGNTDITGGVVYYSIVNSSKDCYKSLSDVQLCQTNGYDYSNTNSTSGVTCSKKSINFGCIASSNLSSTWDGKNSNGSYLDNYLKKDNYKNLKEILGYLGYNNTNFKSNDVVIIEPATLVACSGSKYFGTATALTKKNISYRGTTDNVCKTGDKYNGYTFQNVFRSMYKALKVSASCSDSKYSGCGYFKYNVSGMGYVNPTGNIKIEIKSNGQLITSSNVSFKVYSGNSCSGTLVDTVNTRSGVATLSNKTTGTYTVCQTTDPGNGYVATPISTGGKAQTKQLTSSGQTYTFEYTKNCTSELLNSPKTAEALFGLYKEYKLKGLLNINQPSCLNVSCNSEKLEITGCLAANVNSNFSVNNLSCYDGDPITDAYGNYIGFCKQSLNISNELDNMNTFYSYSGQFLIKKKTDNTGTTYMEVYKSRLDPVNISAPDKIYTDSISTATSEKTCYVLSGKQPATAISSSPASAEIYFGSDQSLDSISNSLPTITNHVGNGLVENKYSIIYKYNFKPIYLEKITGKKVDTKSNKTTDGIIGLLSNFNNSNGNIPFKIKYGNSVITSDACQYDVTKQIVKFDNAITNNKGELNLEFRTIDTKNPFSNREANANWKEKESIITTGINSYGLDADGVKHLPKYVIILNSNDIKIIRDYNEDNKYNAYNIVCENDENGNEVCVNSFLNSLEKGILDGNPLSNQLIRQ